MANNFINFSIFRKKIFKRIFFSFMSSLMFIIFLYGLFTYPMQRHSILEVMHSEAHTLANSIALVCENAMVDDDDTFIVEHNMAVINNNQDIFTITVVKNKSNILETKKNSWRMPEKMTTLLKSFQRKTEQYDIVYDPDLKRDVFYYAMPIVISGIKWGWIHIEFALNKYNHNMQNMFLFLFYLTLGSIVVVFIISFLVARYILEPVLELTKVAKEVAKNNLNIRTKIQRNDEIGDLANDFNTMIEKLEKSKKALKHSHDLLEKRVEERTYELEEKSKELEELNKTLDERVKKESAKSRKNEQLLIQQSRQAAMGEMIGNIAHQWRQPLNALGLVLQNIHFAYQMDELNDEFMQNSIDKGKKLTKSMSKTIDDFRNFFKPNKIKENFNLSLVIKNTIELLEASYNNNNITLKTELDESIVIEGYPSEFSQVILNILSNAKDALIEHKKHNRQVFIKLIQEDTNVFITIEDNAGGIPEDIITKIFDPYFTTKEEGKGTGIGLYMSKMIIENNMSGKISVQNEENGAFFTIILKKNLS